MAADRAQQDGYTARDRHPSDGGMPPSNAAQQHEPHHSNAAPPPPPHHHHHHHHRPADADRDLFLRVEQLEQQIAWNYNAIRGHEDSLARFDRVLGDLQQDVRRALDNLSSEIRSRAPPPGPDSQGRYEQRDVDVLATQIATVASKVHEIDNVKTQIELFKNKLKRLEAESASHTLQIPPRPGTASSFREPHDGTPHPHPPPPAHNHQHQPLPPIHTGAAPAEHNRPPLTYHALPAVENVDHRPPSDEYQYPPGQQQPAESLPPPTTLSGWRPGAGSGLQPPYATRSDPDSGATGWASVKNNQGPKRPFDNDPSAREHSAPASPKRPKLAPLKPRSTFGEDHPPYSGPDGMSYHRGPPHDGPQPPQLLTTPASATAAPNSYRFITATTPSEGPEAWRADDGNLTPASARGRGRSTRGRARPRGSRGENGKEGGTPEWEQKADWHAPLPPQQLSPNGYYHPNAPRPVPRPGEGHPEYPLTPIASAVSPQDYSLMPVDSASGKKTRTKPIRNSEGILIRKDGRPDMRSVSSANNLRKVHAKKEAEKAETDGRTPSSARSLLPARSNSMSEDDGERSEGQGVEASRSATPRTQGDRERSQRLDVPSASAPTSASTDSAADRKSLPVGWYSNREETASENKSSVLLDSSSNRESAEQRPAVISTLEVDA